MNKLFTILPTNFFSVLSAPNRYIYIDCLFIIYESVDTIEDSFSGEREYVIAKLIDYFDDNNHDFQEEGVNTSRQKAVAVINTFKAHGWLGEEELGDYKTSLNFFDYSIKIIEVLRRIKDGEQIQYTGEIFAVYSLVSNFSVEEGVGILEQALSKTKEMLLKLKSLKANIYRFYYSITQHTGKDNLQNLLDLLLIDYKQNFFDSAYYNLKTTDALPRYKKAIVDALNKVYTNQETLEALVSEVCVTKKLDYMDAFAYVEDTIRFINESFEGLEMLVTAIDRKNEQYIHAVTAKIMFLTDNSDNIEGLLNRLFKLMMSQEDYDFSQIFNLVNVRNIDTQSLYSIRRLREEPIIEELDEVEFDDEAYQASLLKVLRPSNMTKEDINDYVNYLLKDRNVINASDLDIKDDNDIIRLLLIFVYSKSIGVEYDIQMLNQEAKLENVRFRNFMIFKKGT